MAVKLASRTMNARLGGSGLKGMLCRADVFAYADIMLYDEVLWRAQLPRASDGWQVNNGTLHFPLPNCNLEFTQEWVDQLDKIMFRIVTLRVVSINPIVRVHDVVLTMDLKDFNFVNPPSAGNISAISIFTLRM